MEVTKAKRENQFPVSKIRHVLAYRSKTIGDRNRQKDHFMPSTYLLTVEPELSPVKADATES